MFDSQPRTISNLTTDQTIRNPADIAAALQRADYSGPTADAQTFINTFNILKAAATSAAFATLMNQRLHKIQDTTLMFL